MDPLTHTLFGAAVAQTRVGRITPMATSSLVIAANLPDVDVFSYFAGSDAALGFRRGWTHGPIGLLLLPLVATGLALAWDRWRQQRDPERPPARPAGLLVLFYLGTLCQQRFTRYGIPDNQCALCTVPRGAVPKRATGLSILIAPDNLLCGWAAQRGICVNCLLKA